MLYAELFTDSYEVNGVISEQLIDSFIAYQHHHLTAQHAMIDNTDIVSEEFPKFQFLYEEGKIESDLVDKLLQRLALDISHLPRARNHGDHNAYNIFNDGLIDLEDSFFGPV